MGWFSDLLGKKSSPKPDEKSVPVENGADKPASPILHRRRATTSVTAFDFKNSNLVSVEEAAAAAKLSKSNGAASPRDVPSSAPKDAEVLTSAAESSTHSLSSATTSTPIAVPVSAPTPISAHLPVGGSPASPSISGSPAPALPPRRGTTVSSSLPAKVSSLASSSPSSSSDPAISPLVSPRSRRNTELYPIPSKALPPAPIGGAKPPSLHQDKLVTQPASSPAVPGRT